MDPNVQRQLVEINAQFYQTFSMQFSATRQRVQPGVFKALKLIGPENSVLDIGCGNGNLLPALLDQGFSGRYTGIDFSPALVKLAEERAQELTLNNNKLRGAFFLSSDLSRPGWDITGSLKPVDFITAFAVLHHLPACTARLELFKTFRRLLEPDGKLLISFWQFLNSERLKRRIVDWSEVNIPATALDENDFLLDWRSGGTGFRYVHLFNEHELRDLAAQSGFKIEESYFSDGKEGNLGLYQTWSVQY